MYFSLLTKLTTAPTNLDTRNANELTGSWCNDVSETETYCCGFGAQASCVARGLDYSGSSTPCEVKLVTSDDGTTCEGIDGVSGNLSEDAGCNCEGGLGWVWLGVSCFLV